MTCVDLFAGCGGMAKGFELAGFRHEALIEKDPTACRSLRKNFDPSTVKEFDVRDYDFGVHKNVDVISGGPPCQPFSNSGCKKGQEDPRDMFPEAISIVHIVRPKVFIFENVAGLASPRFSNYMKIILERMKNDADYDVKTAKINSADYGIPQTRTRLFFVGTRKDLNTKWHFPVPTHQKNATIQKNIFENAMQKWVTLGEALKGLPEPEEGKDCDSKYRPGAIFHPKHSGSSLDAPAKTVVSTSYGTNNTVKRKDGSVRFMSIDEIKRVQTFPDDYVLEGTWVKKIKQLGNAVPVKLAYIFALQIKKMFHKNE